MLYVFKIIGKKIKYSPRREGASSRLRKDNAAGKFGNTILWPNCWTVRVALSQSILLSCLSRVAGCSFEGKSRFKSSKSSYRYSNPNAKFQFHFWNKTGSFSFEAYQATYFLLYNTHTCTCHIIKLSKLQNYVFHHYKAWERKLVFVCFLKNLERQNEN